MIDLQDAMHSLQNASDLDLLRLSTAIGHLLRNPARMMAIRRYLHLGQEIEFWNTRDTRTQRRRIIAFKPDQLVVQTETPRVNWTIMYAAASSDPAAKPAQPPPERCLQPLTARRSRAAAAARPAHAVRRSRRCGRKSHSGSCQSGRGHNRPRRH